MKKVGEGKDDEKLVYIHDEFDEFARKDTPVSFLKLFFGAMTITLFKFFAPISFAVSLSIKLFGQLKKRKKKKKNLLKRKLNKISNQ